MKINEAIFLKSITSYKDRPTERPAFVFIGRSNVGKSSLLNMLLNRKGLAKISSKPGKTKLINYFLINQSWYLVDLPGYGWAQVSKQTKVRWLRMVKDYLQFGESFLHVFLLIDGRLPPQQKDLDFINWLGNNNISCTIVATKIDGQKKRFVNHNIHLFKEKMLAHWESLPPFFLTSSQKKQGRDTLLDHIHHILATYNLSSLPTNN